VDADLAIQEPVMLDKIRAGLLLQGDPFEEILDPIIMPSIFDKPVRDAEATLKIPN
jgi:hypothetical protein